MFAADMRAGVDVLHGSSVLLSIDFDLALTGPMPLHAHGVGHFHVLFLDVSVSFNQTIGDSSQAPPLPATDVWPLLQHALQDPQNWRAALPPDSDRIVTLANAPIGEQTLVVHPMGRLTVHERVLPLNFQISLFGSATPRDYDRFRVLPPSLNGSPAAHHLVEQDFFAPGQFETLSQSDQLSKPSYEPFDAIITFGSTHVQCGSASFLDVRYQTYYIEDPNVPAASMTSTYRPDSATQAAMIGQGAAARSPIGAAKYTVSGLVSPITTSVPRYIIASVDTLQINTALSIPGGTSQAAADATLAAYLGVHPEDTTLQVIPAHEAVG
jgi:hypothetical protein